MRTLLTALISLALGEGIYAQVVYVPPNQGAVAIGSGVKTMRAEAAGRCVAQSPTTATQGEPLVRYFSNLTSRESFLRRVLNVSAAADFGFGSWGGSGEASFASDDSSSSFSLYYYLDVQVDLGQGLLDTYRLVSPYDQITSPSEFYNKCGDRVVVGTQSGGRFTALLRFSTDSFSSRRALETKLSGYSLGSGSGGGSLSEVVESAGASVRKTAYIFREGLSTPLPDTNDLNAMEREALSFVNAIKNSGGRIRNYVTVDYSAVSNLPASITPIVTAQQHAVLEDLAQQRTKYLTALADIFFARANRPQFLPFDDAALSEHETKIRQLLDSNFKVANECSSKPVECAMLAKPAEIALALPKPLSDSQRYYRFPNGVILDAVTKLEWNPISTWHGDTFPGLCPHEAQQWCQVREIGGWRLPTLAEMEALTTNVAYPAMPDSSNPGTFRMAYLPEVFADEILLRYKAAKSAYGWCSYISSDTIDPPTVSRPSNRLYDFCERKRDPFYLPRIQHCDRPDRSPYMCVRRSPELANGPQ